MTAVSIFILLISGTLLRLIWSLSAGVLSKCMGRGTRYGMALSLTSL